MNPSRQTNRALFPRSVLLAVLGLTLVTVVPVWGTPPIHFRDATESSGIHFVHNDGSTGKRYIMETVASGLGLIDYNGDGWPDIYFLTGAPLPEPNTTNRPAGNALYRNNRDGTFTDVTAQSGTGIYGDCFGCVVADYDNDGFEDIFVTGYGRNWLLHNNGDGTFTDVTEKSGLGGSSYPGCIGAGCAFLDYDRDGNLDLYVGHYLKFDLASAKPWTLKNVPAYCNPRSFAPVASQLFHNNGDGTFTDVSDSSGIGKHKGYAMGVVCSDFDGDGWPDIFVGNDVMENFLFHNKHDGTFEEIALPAGVAYDQFGDPVGAMGANVGDFDGDGRPDIVVTDYQSKLTILYRNLGNMLFQDVTAATGAGTGSFAKVKWGCGLVDFDNDGVLELFTAAGHLQDLVEQYDRSTTYKERGILLQQKGNRFVDVTMDSGALQDTVQSSRGVVFGDLNNDGKLDAVMANSRARPTVMFNETVTTNHWITLKLAGVRSNRSAVGAVARVTAGGRTQMDEVRAGRAYQGGEDLRLHFGLGSAQVVDHLEVRWPSGITNAWKNLKPDQIILLKENVSPSAPISPQ